MRPISSKLRLLHVLKTLIKYTDKGHKMTRAQINEHLKPYGIEFTQMSSFRSFYDELKEFGFDIKEYGSGASSSAYLDEKPIKLDDIRSLVFAVTTNPHIGKDEAGKLLSCLKPMMSIYEEEYLTELIERKETGSKDFEKATHIYKIVYNAIKENKRLRYRRNELWYDHDSESLVEHITTYEYIIPKCIYEKENKWYLLGYQTDTNSFKSILLKNISEIEIAPKGPKCDFKQVKGIIATEDVVGHLKSSKKPIYEGEATFVCRAPHLTLLYETFGPAAEPIKRDIGYNFTYKVKHAKIYPSTLNILTAHPNKQLRIIGPDKLIKAVKEYYQETTLSLLYTEKKKKGIKKRMKETKFDAIVMDVLL